MSFFKTKLREVSKELYLEHGWQMPRGFVDSEERDPRNFTLGQWQQAKRMGRDTAQLKATIQECWAASDNGKSFASALERRGLYLARGDRRGHVAVTYEGEVLSIARLTGKKTKEIVARLGDPASARSVADTRAHIAATIAPRLTGLIREADVKRVEALAPLDARRLAMRKNHRRDRQRLDEQHRKRQTGEAKARNARLRKGVMGLWDRLTGRRAETIRENEADARHCFMRDRTERQTLVGGQLDKRRQLQKSIRVMRDHHAGIRQELYGDLVAQRQGHEQGAEGTSLRPAFTGAATSLRRMERARGSREAGRERGSRSGGYDLGR